MIYFTTGHFKLAGGVMITASHNPASTTALSFAGKTPNQSASNQDWLKFVNSASKVSGG
jgi:phosphomannomutase